MYYPKHMNYIFGYLDLSFPQVYYVYYANVYVWIPMSTSNILVTDWSEVPLMALISIHQLQFEML